MPKKNCADSPTKKTLEKGTVPSATSIRQIQNKKKRTKNQYRAEDLQNKLAREIRHIVLLHEV